METNIEAVITSFNQGSMILEAVQSLCKQTNPPKRIIIVDDGSTDKQSLDILDNIKTNPAITIPILVIKQPNRGVSVARNTGISQTKAPLVLVLDGDDQLEPSYIEQVSQLFHNDPSMVAASSWMKTFGTLEATVCPSGGNIIPFLSRNCCPATHILRRDIWQQCGGYDESMRSGFEDWEFFLSMLECIPEANIGIVEQALIDYRTAPASFNIKSMSKRLELMHFIIEKHFESYQKHLTDAILGIESISMARLNGWENEIIHSINTNQSLSKEATKFIESPSYGDGGMAAAIRIVSIKQG